MFLTDLFNINRNKAWNILRSPKTVAALKLGAAIIAVIHAIDEFSESSKSGKRQIGFSSED